VELCSGSWWDVWGWERVAEQDQQKCTRITCVAALVEYVRVSHTSEMSSLTATDDGLYSRARRRNVVKHSTVGSNAGHACPGKELATTCPGT